MKYSNVNGWGVWGPPKVPAPTGPIILSKLGAPLAAIPDTTSGSTDEATINAILATLRSLGLIAP